LFRSVSSILFPRKRSRCSLVLLSLFQLTDRTVSQSSFSRFVYRGCRTDALLTSDNIVRNFLPLISSQAAPVSPFAAPTTLGDSAISLADKLFKCPLDLTFFLFAPGSLLVQAGLLDPGFSLSVFPDLLFLTRHVWSGCY